MKKTPEEVSKLRQKLYQEAEAWRAGIAAARLELELSPTKQAEIAQRLAYGNEQLALCAKEIKKLYRKGKKQFWK
jgi:hypothetical protein